LLFTKSQIGGRKMSYGVERSNNSVYGLAGRVLADNESMLLLTNVARRIFRPEDLISDPIDKRFTRDVSDLVTGDGDALFERIVGYIPVPVSTMPVYAADHTKKVQAEVQIARPGVQAVLDYVELLRTASHTNEPVLARIEEAAISASNEDFPGLDTKRND
jgi:hypothetical protein